MVRSVCALVEIWRMLCDGLYQCRVIEYVDGVDSVGYVVGKCSIACCAVEDVGACVIVTITKEGVNEGVIVLVVT